ncbi:MAG: hypothetical protein LC687_04800 [Actinobacteria bacterium]|nr:hypothetical protein [Actinomycetota bacterium]MCA1807152.1 hypothetical protein [Actinomycetota bacterium]
MAPIRTFTNIMEELIDELNANIEIPTAMGIIERGLQESMSDPEDLDQYANSPHAVDDILKSNVMQRFVAGWLEDISLITEEMAGSYNTDD